MKSKSIVSLLLILTMGTTMLSGCGSKENKDVSTTSSSTQEESKSEDSKSQDKKAEDEEKFVVKDNDGNEVKPEDGAKIKLWMDNDDYNQQIVSAFNEIYPEVEVTVENVGGVDARGKLELSGPTGEAADVFVQPHDNVAVSAQAGLIVDVNEFSNEVKKEFMPNAVDAASYKGKLYSLPLNIKTIALFYNKKLVDKPVETWEELLEFAKTFNDPSQNKFALYWQANEPYYAHMALSAFGYQIFGEKHDDKTKLGWTTPEAIEGMKFYKTLKALYPVPAQDASYDAMMNNFVDGKAPYAIAGPWCIKGFKDAGLEFGVNYLPTVKGKHPETLSTVDVACISSFSKYPKAAKVFAKFMQSNKGLLLMYNTTQALPASIKLQESEEIKKDEYLSGIAKQAKYSIPMPFIPEMANVWDPYKKAFTAVWDGISEPEEALKNAQDEFQTNIKSK